MPTVVYSVIRHSEGTQEALRTDLIKLPQV
jgi:hypothetical protein